MKQALVKTGKWMLVVLFLSYYISATSFYHTHYYSWGTVTHSHFYFPFGDNAQQHNHTQTQCQTIHMLSSIILACLTITVIYKITQIRRIFIPIRSSQSHVHLIASPLRAPPSLLLQA